MGFINEKKLKSLVYRVFLVLKTSFVPKERVDKQKSHFLGKRRKTIAKFSSSSWRGAPG